MRTIKHSIKAFKINMGGTILDQALPFKGVDQIDPFLLIHHWKDELKGGEHQSTVGVGPHPHRGFSPVTFIFQGGVHHRDSLGTSEVVYSGGTQWMNSGSGIVHSERPAKELAEDGGTFEIIQFWMNAPAKHKMDEASYQPYSKEDTPLIISEDKKVETYVVAGELEDKKGPAIAHSDVLILRLNMQKDGYKEIAIPESYNALIYQLEGKIKVGEKEFEGKNLIHFNNDGTSIAVKALEDTKFIVLSGAPINEDVSAYGPFVMNTEDEIRQAIIDYQNGKMGILTENFD
ncbi:pirin family protein [Paracrocinitomix mangrovi]|uniref:pirin family protein n=1 Tax=Paracrocinitomix mangrovi TaxID=2862509 RepID=UPI001C8E2AD7|nr:pirin-like C-terminal cupin domain-containing protein [Paracrocinitomix mangrovi]UKN02362.1 pirin family protein [Paracrocinitomix mangrovi]